MTSEFQDLITRYAWGEIWTRPGLDRRTRSCITLTALVANGQLEELAMHVRAARRNGLSDDEIKEVLLQCAIYCGVPAANAAFAVAQRALAEEQDDQRGSMSTVELEQQRLLIGGEWTEATRRARRSSASTRTPAKRVDACRGREPRRTRDRAVEAAHAAFRELGRHAARKRGAAAQRRRRPADGARGRDRATMTEEVGGTFGWGMFNCDLAVADAARGGAPRPTRAGGEVIPSDVPGALSFAVRQPAGVVVGMAPWNAPVILSTRAVATPLAFGNTVVLKGSEQCPRTHAAVVGALHDAGLPAGAINLVLHSADDAPEVVEALIAHPAVRRVNFTGSTRVGRIVAMKCAEHMKRCLLELSGKAPMVVLADADLDAAADAASFGAFMNSGQICMSTERIVVDRGVADELGGGSASAPASSSSATRATRAR